MILRWRPALLGLLVLAGVIVTGFHAKPVRAAASSCETLRSHPVQEATIDSAAFVRDGTLVLPRAAANGADSNESALSDLPQFCRVTATLTPSHDSDIHVEVWLPLENWNRKYEAVGNGAFNGAIAYPAMAGALRAGYATSATDTGHSGNTASFAVGHPEKVTDFAWRAVHEMTRFSKQLIATYYGDPAMHSYWNGCSAGGRQAFKEAQRFPGDFDGIIAGAPGLDWTGRAAQAVASLQVLQGNEAAQLGAAKRQLLHKAVVEACDSLDGVRDGLIGDPTKCRFDPGVLECKGPDEPSCLTPAQVRTARMLYASRVNPRTKRTIAGLERGSELGWTDQGWTASARATGVDQFRFLVFKDPRWSIAQFNFDTDMAQADEIDNDSLNALDPNLKPFIERGGKLIQYHGWSDPQIAPGNSTQYYESVVNALGGATQVRHAYRLFMVPGMGHCGGGDGPSTFDAVAALEAWVEQGQPPDQMIARQRATGRSRPLCPYPQVARYRGGSIDAAASFTCQMP
jgi:feruloyl esterase